MAYHCDWIQQSLLITDLPVGFEGKKEIWHLREKKELDISLCELHNK